MELYHASKEIVQYPEIRKAKYTKDFCGDFIVLIICSRQTDGQIVVLVSL